MRRCAVLAVSVLCSALVACGAGHYVQRGADLYGQGRYVEADEVFERSQARLARAGVSELERSHPGALARDEREFLDGAWRAFESRLPATPPAPAGTAVASSSQAPSVSVGLVPPPAPATVLPQ
jgi:hypothetical protein